MAANKTVEDWFAAYAANHRNPTNELIHWVCVPAIFFSVLGFAWSIPVPREWTEAVPWFNWALAAMVVATAFYFWISPRLSAGMLFFMSVCYMGLALIDLFAPWPVWQVSAAIFVLGWIGQFIGHRVEGGPPSFFRDALFLLIGPAWLMSFVYRKLGQQY